MRTMHSSVDKVLPINKATEVLGCNRSYVYRMIKCGQLEKATDAPLTVTATSVVRKLVGHNPYLQKHYSSIHWDIAQEAQQSFN